MDARAGAKRVGVAAWQEACRRLGPHRLVKLVQRGTTDADLRAVLVELLNRESIVIEFERAGRRWCAPTGDEIFTELFLRGEYQVDDVLALDDWVAHHLDRASREVIVDVGANIGTTTCPLAHRKRRLIAIEPVPTTYALLERNVQLQGLGDRVATVNCAVAADGGSLQMVLTAGSGSNEVVLDGRPPAFAQFGMKASSEVRVESRRLDEIVRTAGHQPDELRFVWSDTQGYEGDVIESGHSLWSAGVPLYLEVWPHALDRRYGIGRFTALVGATFTSFVGRADLRPGSANGLRPIAELPSFIAGIDRWTDALLVP